MKLTDFAKSKLAPFILGGLSGIFFLLYIFNGLEWESSPLIVSLVLVTATFGVLAIWVQAKLSKKKLFLVREKDHKILALAAALLFGFLLLLSNAFPHPVFAAQHALKICVFYPDGANPVVIRQIRDQYGAPIPLVRVKGEQPWNLNGTELIAQASGACAEWQDFFKGSIAVYMKTSPGQGKAEITWDGHNQTIDLDSPIADTVKIDLSGASLDGGSALRNGIAILGRASRVATFAIASLIAAVWIVQATDNSLVHGVLGRAVMILAALDLTVLGQLGKSVSMVADDFCFAAASIGRGVYQGALVIYTTVNGRLAPAFLDSLSGSLFPRNPFAWSVWVSLLLWAVLLDRLIWSIGKSLFSKFPRFGSVLLSGSALIVALSTTPNLLQSVYWHSGRTPLVDPILLFLAGLLLVPAVFKSSRVGFYVALTFFISLLAGMFHEAFAASQIVFWIGCLIFILINQNSLPAATRRKLVVLGFACVLGATIGLLTNIFSPGTAERTEALGTTFSLLDFVRGTFVDTGWFFTYRTINALGLALFGLAVLIGRESATPKATVRKFLPKIWLVLPVLLISVLGASLAVSRFGLGGMLPERTQIVPVFWSALFLAGWGLVTGALTPKSRLVSVPVRFAQTAIFIVLAGALVYQALWAAGFRDRLDRYAVSVSGLWNQVDIGHAAGLSHVVVNNFEPNPFGLADPGREESTFVNGCLERLAGLRVEFVGE